MSTEAERSCDSTLPQLRRTVYVPQAAVLHTGHRGFSTFFFLVLQLLLKLAIEKKQRLLWVFFTFAPQTEHMAFYRGTSQL